MCNHPLMRRIIFRLLSRTRTNYEKIPRSKKLLNAQRKIFKHQSSCSKFLASFTGWEFYTWKKYLKSWDLRSRKTCLGNKKSTSTKSQRCLTSLRMFSRVNINTCKYGCANCKNCRCLTEYSGLDPDSQGIPTTSQRWSRGRGSLSRQCNLRHYDV